MAYNKDMDYQKLIDDAVGKGNFGAAAQYEQARNEKIDGEGLTHPKTSKYTQYLPEGDGSAGAFDSGRSGRPTYASQRQSRIDSLSDALLGRDAFSYDPEADPLYKSYQGQYTRQGQTAMQNTLGQVAARTGGMASSYAGMAAQQTYDGYMQALSDKIPELQQAAYEKYRDQGNDLRDNISMLQSQENNDYARYLDSLSQYNTDRQFDDSKGRDAISDARYADETAYGRGIDARDFAYQQGRDAVSDSRWQKEFNDSAQQDALSRSTRSSGSSSGKSSGGSSDSGKYGVEDLYADMQASGDPYTYLVLNGYSPAEASGILRSGGYYLWVDRQRIAPAAKKHTYLIEGMGELGEDDVLKLLDARQVYVTSWDKDGNPTSFAATGNAKKGRTGSSIAMTR